MIPEPILDLDLGRDWEAAVRELGALGDPARVERALKRAVRKLARWAFREMTRRYARESGVPQKTLRRYRRVAMRVGDLRADLWAGLDPFPAHAAGRVSWSRRSPGARVRGRLFEGAFYRAVYGSEAKVWIRVARNRSARLPLYHPPRNWRPMGDDGPDRGRFPVALVAWPVATAAAPLTRGLEREARARFARLARQELRYALDVEGRR